MKSNEQMGPIEAFVKKTLLEDGFEQNDFGVISASIPGGSMNLVLVIAEIVAAYVDSQPASKVEPIAAAALKAIKTDIRVTDETGKAAVVKVAIEGASVLLKKTFDMCELKTHIQGNVIFEETSEVYQLSFTKAEFNH